MGCGVIVVVEFDVFYVGNRVDFVFEVQILWWLWYGVEQCQVLVCQYFFDGWFGGFLEFVIVIEGCCQEWDGIKIEQGIFVLVVGQQMFINWYLVGLDGVFDLCVREQ